MGPTEKLEEQQIEDSIRALNAPQMPNYPVAPVVERPDVAQITFTATDRGWTEEYMEYITGKLATHHIREQ